MLMNGMNTEHFYDFTILLVSTILLALKKKMSDLLKSTVIVFPSEFWIQIFKWCLIVKQDKEDCIWR